MLREASMLEEFYLKSVGKRGEIRCARGSEVV